MPRPAFVAACLLAAGCGRDPTPTPPAAAVEAPAERPGLHNVVRVGDRLWSGSAPVGEAGFRSLTNMGVRTVITVDGAKPDLEAARRAGLRYVHLPVGYDGVPAEQAVRIARAVRDLPGPVYLHCHHGKHRGPAAAACAARLLDPAFTAGDAADLLRRAGTDPRYRGLFASVARPPAGDLGGAGGPFPEVAATPDLVRLMVDVDERWDRLKAAHAAGWAKPTDAGHDATLLAEHFGEAARLPDAPARGPAFRASLADAERAAADLDAALRATPPDAVAAGRAFAAGGKVCTTCHAAFRDVR